MSSYDESQYNDSYIPETNHCKGCKFAAFDMEGNYCTSKESLAVAPLFGRSCWSARFDETLCGKEGRLFVRKVD